MTVLCNVSNKILIIIFLTLTLITNNLISVNTQIIPNQNYIIYNKNNNVNNNNNKINNNYNLISNNLKFNKNVIETTNNLATSDTIINIFNKRLENLKKEKIIYNDKKKQRFLSTKYNNKYNYGEDNDDNSNDYDKIENENNSTTSVYFDDFDFNLNSQCILGTSETYLSWWISDDGSLVKNIRVNNFNTEVHLDLSKSYFSEKSIEEHLSSLRETNFVKNIRFLSIAQNNLERIPRVGLSLLNRTLEYLSVTGNYFHLLNADNMNDETWSTFPLLFNLKELDMRNCSILHIYNGSFENLPNLEKLFLSYNQLVFISETVFTNLPNLIHLDLSYNNFSQSTKTTRTASIDPYAHILEGITLEDTIFINLTKLIFLDLSYTKLSPTSAKAFSYLGKNLQQLSLCYTGLTIIAPQMFVNTNLKILDISGNPSTSPLMKTETFKGLDDKLEILSYEYSNVKTLNWLYFLKKLTILKLKGNNINQLTNSTFANLKSIQLMDLSSNHISNWYDRIFLENTKLKILNIRENNINIMTNEMFNDFSNLNFLATGNNNFICNCVLREFIEKGASNSHNINCTVKLPENNEETNDNKMAKYNVNAKTIISKDYDVSLRIYKDYLKSIDNINTKKITSKKQTKLLNFKILNEQQKSSVTIRTPSVFLQCNRTTTIPKNCSNNFQQSVTDEKMQFEFQLLDFNENDYVCINATNNKKYFLHEIQKCLINGANLPNLPQIEVRTNSLAFVLIGITTLLIIYLICYYKWWYIRYFFILVKNATILSFIDKEKDFGKRKSNTSEIITNGCPNNFTYDVFVSYCDENRDWILNEFLPNIEEQEINVCLHERDFQVGLSILENIISSMDRSRVLLLIVSENFLLSQWCQFEMHLAQHRLLETRREHLILVLLEDIPKRKRPKTLQYLMKIKTYIKWPTELEKTKKSNVIIENIDKSMQPVSKLLNEERKLFWKRLKKAFLNVRPSDKNAVSLA